MSPRIETSRDRHIRIIMVFPAAFDIELYRKYADLSEFPDEYLIAHYNLHGKREGRYGCSLETREDFAQLTGDTKTLEIGPFANPSVSGPNVTYCDVLTTEQLRARAEKLGIDSSRVPEVKYALGSDTLDIVTEKFDSVISSHCIEHQPDLIRHLREVASLLNDHGRYFMMVPDKRYCFDRHQNVSTIADVMQAWNDARKAHALKSVIEHRAIATHNDPIRHWTKEDYKVIDPATVAEAIVEHNDANGKYIDVHAWYFTPDSFIEIMNVLHSTSFTSFSIEALYRTRYASNEFWVILNKGSVELRPTDIENFKPENRP
jgi:SAM-dependent methyltransferase